MFIFFRNPLFLLSLAGTIALSVVLCTLPMSSTLGFEFAFASGIVIPLLSGHMATTVPFRLRSNTAGATIVSENITPWRLLGSALLPGTVLLFVSLFVSLINQLFVPPCNTLAGLLFFLLLPVFSTLCAVGTGLFIGLLVKHRRKAIAAWYVVWGFTVGCALWQAYFTPAVYSYGIFFGYWPGVWYDTEISITPELLSFRLYNLAILGTLFMWARTFFNWPQMAIQIKKVPIVRVLPLIFATIATISFAGMGETLGHRISTRGLQQSLSRHVHIPGLNLYFDNGIPAEIRGDMVSDAAYSLAALHHFFAVSSHPDFDIFIFNTADQKHRLMGARNTSVAKPWLGQAYIVAEDTPHWTLRHEMAHLLAANFGTGPFRIAARQHGLIPIPALIEGIPTAATPTKDLFSLHQRASALQKLKLLPPVSTLMGIGFLGLFSGSAYTASGSFCLFLKEKYGATALKKLYRGASARQATGKSMAQLEAQWHQFLLAVPVSTSQVEELRFRFDRPAIVETRCVREVTRLQKQAQSLLGEQQCQQAKTKLHEAWQVSGESTDTALQLFFSWAGCKPMDAVTMGQRLLRGKPGMVRERQIEEALTDIQMSQMPPEVLSKAYRQLAHSTASVDDARRLAIKSHLASIANPSAKRLLQYLSVVPSQKRISTGSALYSLVQLTQGPAPDPLLLYLTARILFQEREYADAARVMKQAVSVGLAQKFPLFITEARFTLGRSLLRLRRYSLATEQFTLIQVENSSQEGIVRLAEDWQQRVRWQESR